MLKGRELLTFKKHDCFMQICITFFSKTDDLKSLCPGLKGLPGGT